MTVAQSIAQQAEEVNGILKTTGDSLAVSLSLHGEEVNQRLIQTGQDITSAIDESGTGLAERLAQTGDAIRKVIVDDGSALEADIAQTGERLSKTLTTQIETARTTFEGNTTALSTAFRSRQTRCRASFSNRSRPRNPRLRLWDARSFWPLPHKACASTRR